MAAAYFDKEKTFAQMGLDSRIFKAIAVQQLIYPTLIQAKCIPLALEGRDILARARTGSGKTYAYAIPLIQQILTAKETERGSVSGVRGLVLVPTKELSDQVFGQLSSLLIYCKATISCYAMSSKGSRAEQAARLREVPDILISTPSRLVEHVRAGTVDLKQSLQMLVIDEADLVLSYGYDEDVKTLMDYFPKLFQTLLMSATLSPEIEALKKLVLHNPAVLKLEDGNAGEEGKLHQFFMRCTQKDKFLLAYALLKLQMIKGKTLFFVNSVDGCFRLKLFLEQFSIPSAVLNSELPYNSRAHIIEQFNRGVFDYLIATDASIDEDDAAADGDKDGVAEAGADGAVEDMDIDDGHEAKKAAANKTSKEQRVRKRKADGDLTVEYGVSRGVDFQHVRTVVNFDFPTSIKSYVHRVGRTARGGAAGYALSLVHPGEQAHLQELQTQQADETPESQIQPLEVRMADVEGFRYRVEDILRSVTQAAVREARVKELKAELLNSEKLKAHFEDNPHELKLLKHDKVLRPAKVQAHLQHVPSYLLPPSLSVPDDGQALRPGKPRNMRLKAPGPRTPRMPHSGNKRKQQDDPLKTFSYDNSSSDGGASRGGGRGRGRGGFRGGGRARGRGGSSDRGRGGRGGGRGGSSDRGWGGARGAKRFKTSE